jgi:hypothetical protein
LEARGSSGGDIQRLNEVIAEEQADAAHGVSDDDGSRHNKTRQFLMKVSYSSKSLSSAEAVAWAEA